MRTTLRVMMIAVLAGVVPAGAGAAAGQPIEFDPNNPPAGWRVVGPNDPVNVSLRWKAEAASPMLTGARARAMVEDLIRLQSAPGTKWYLWHPVVTALDDAGRFPPDLRQRFVSRIASGEWPVKSEIPAGSVWPLVLELRWRGFAPAEEPKFGSSANPVVVKAVRGPWIDDELVLGERPWHIWMISSGTAENNVQVVASRSEVPGWVPPSRIELEPGQAYRVRFEVDLEIDLTKDGDNFFTRHREMGLPMSGTSVIEKTVRITEPRPVSTPIVEAEPLQAWLRSLAWRIRTMNGGPTLYITSVNLRPDGTAESLGIDAPPAAFGFRVALRRGEQRWELGNWVHSRLRDRLDFGPSFALPADAAAVVPTAQPGELQVVFTPWDEPIADLCRDNEVVYGGGAIEIPSPTGPIEEARFYQTMGGRRSVEPTEPFGPAFIDRRGYR